MKRELNVEIKGDNSDYKKKLDESKKETKDFAKETSKVKFDVAKPEEINKVRERLKLLKEEQQDLAELIKRRSQAHSITDIAEYNERIAETTQRINILQAATHDNFNIFTKGVRAASSSLSGLAGALSLLGGSEEQRAKLMRVTISLMAIGNAAHRIAMMEQRSHLMALLKVKYENIKASISSALAIKSETSAKTSASFATNILTKTTALWNKTIAANPIIAVIAAVVALTAAAYALTKAFSSNNEKAKGYETTLDGVIIKDETMRKAHNDHIMKLRRLQVEWDYLTGSINKHEKAIRELSLSYQEAMKEIRDDTEKKLEEATGFWAQFKKVIIGFAKGNPLEGFQRNMEQIVEITEHGFSQITNLTTEENKELALINERARQDELVAAAEHAVLMAATKRQELNARISLSRQMMEREMQEYAEGSAQALLTQAKHENRVIELRKAHNAELAKIQQDALRSELEAAKKAQDFMFAESIAYWQREIILNENMGAQLMQARLNLLETETAQRLIKVEQGSEQELLILEQGNQKRLAITREGFGQIVTIYDSFNEELAKKLAITNELHTIYGATYDLLGEQINIYKSEIDKLINDGYTAEDEAVTKMIAKLNELSLARDNQIKDNERVKRSQQQLEAVTTDLASSFGAAMGAMAKDGKDASEQLIKQALATAMAFIINQVLQEVDWPYNLIVAAGAGAVTYALFDQVPALAQGGVATGPTLAMVGDNPNAKIDPEIIAPLSKLKNMIQPTAVEANDISKVVFEIRGDTLIGLFDKYNSFQNKYK
jgi:hypothetical protein